ncbi:hypothetical protein ACFL34_05000, partial [Candidatus Sumerlaeota bacterium]
MRTVERTTSEVLLILLTSFVIAFVIWFMAKRADVETENLTVPIRLGSVPQMIETKIDPNHAIISVQYPKNQKQWIMASNFTVIVTVNDIRGHAGIGQFESITMPLSPEMIQASINVPPVIHPANIRPAAIDVSAQWRLEQAQIQPTIIGEVAPGYQLDGPIGLASSTILLTGSGSAFAQAPRDDARNIIVRTDPIDLSGKNKTFGGKTSPRIPEDLWPFSKKELVITDAQATIPYSVAIVEQKQQRQFQRVPVQLITLVRNVKYEVAPTHVAVTVNAPLSLLDDITPEHIAITALQPLDESKQFSGEVAI